MGFTTREIAQLKKSVTLEKTVAGTAERLINENALMESFEKFRKAELLLKPHRGKYLPEIRVRKLIRKTGVKTFPRPKEIPNNFRIKVTNKGGGMKYVHPKNEGTYVRVMPGKPHSPNSFQQKPYVNQRIDGKSLDKFGNIVENASPEAHIPIEEFVYKNE